MAEPPVGEELQWNLKDFSSFLGGGGGDAVDKYASGAAMT